MSSLSTPKPQFLKRKNHRTQRTVEKTPAQKRFQLAPEERRKQQDEVYFNQAMKKMQNFKLQGLLENHCVNERLRAKMMDWMIEVLKIYSQREETIFRAFFLLDYFLWKSSEKVPAKKLHLLGTVCIMIASKNQEVQFIHTDQIIKNVSYNKFTKEEILATELEVLRVIEFKANLPTLYDLCRCGFRFISFQDIRI